MKLAMEHNFKLAKDGQLRKDAVWQWIWQYPLFLIVLAFLTFSIGLWNQAEGYYEDTNPLSQAIKSINLGQFNTDLYTSAFILLLKGITNDPLNAAILMRFLTSFATTIMLYLVLRCFSKYLRKEAIICTCFVWTASSLNAPIMHSTSASAFAFVIMLAGVYCLLKKISFLNILGFYFFAFLALSLRPEYMAPTGLITIWLVGWKSLQLLRRLRFKFGISQFKIIVSVIFSGIVFFIFILMNPPLGLLNKLKYIDQYLLFGLGQCYSEFYHIEHPDEPLDAMTEYKKILDKTFNKPSTFIEAVKNNPKETARYFKLNSKQNLRLIPQKLLTTRDHGQAPMINILDKIIKYVLILGGIFGIFRIINNILKIHRKSTHLKFMQELMDNYKIIFQKILILILLTSASSLAVIMLVPSPRYWISDVPILYLLLAYSFDSLVKGFKLTRLGPLFVIAAFIGFCRPNFIISRPNYSVEALRHIAPLIRSTPVIATWWADPYCVLAFRGEAKPVSLSDIGGIKAEDFISGKIDVLMIDTIVRSSTSWANQRSFFETFVKEPQKYGFTKLTGFSAGGTEFFYRPKISVSRSQI